MNNSVVPILACFLLSCALINPKGNADCFVKIKIYVKDKWEYDKVKNYYIEKPGLLGLTRPEYYNCVKTLSRKQIVKIFGKSSEINSEKNSLSYYQSPDCNKNRNNCQKLYFILNEGKVIEFGFTAPVSKSH